MTTVEQEICNLIYEQAPEFGGRPKKGNGAGANADPMEAEGDLPGPSEETLAQAIERQERNAHFALDRFGFGSMFWPTLQDMADRYDGLGTRERVRQILDKLVFQRIENDQRPVARQIAQLVQARAFWAEDELLEALNDAGLVDSLDYFQGLLEYLQHQDLLADWKVVKPDMAAVTRKTYHEHGQCFVVSPERKSHLKRTIKRARKIVGLNGLCQLSHLAVDPETSAEILALLKAHNDAWVTFSKGAFWYTFDDRHSTLVSHAQKIFTLVDHVDLEDLATLLQNSLFHRSSRFKEYPDAEIVREWIVRSDRFRSDGNVVSFRGEATGFSDIEEDLISLLRGQGPTETTQIRRKLEARGHGTALLSKIVYYSPLVYVDRSRGRKNFLITLVTDLPGQQSTVPDDYFAFKVRLDALASTDKDTTGTARKEQRILSEWIFRDSTHIRCAICDREFARGSIITAHKKKRAHCTDTERRDPNIVFPLCIFGCDHLYERGFIRVVEGHVTAGRAPTGQTEYDIVQKLVGHLVDARWRAGPPDYFDMRPDETHDDTV
ncbi:hypothetical protein DQW77_14755 [Roseovarius sp. TE539]|uniref:hypothetical protein n=1 Tax=Roseovarius sp. TE539 TaxID=2249812 RepID=UPI000DDF3781|nr:hypothetical protein [Roseovarius sp. TE539]RBI69999.1 hypothetical protein DQW77_14755 [Roseovarius sp. TE539]